MLSFIIMIYFLYELLFYIVVIYVCLVFDHAC